MLLKGNRGFFSSLVISTVAFLELILLWRILRSENHKYEESSCEGVERRLFARSGGLSELAGPLDITRWHAWNNFGACKNLKFFGGRLWRKADKHQDYMDGHKAVCLDEQIRPVPGNCLVYSFGVNDNWSFEDAMLKYGCEVHGFDPTIGEPKQTGERQFIFHKIGLQGKDEIHTKGWQMKSFRSIMKLLGHEKRIIDVVKMDIEQSEYEAIPNMIETGVMGQIKQIALETHNYGMVRSWRETYIIRYQQIWKLEKHGFVRFSSQAGMGTDKLNEIANISDHFIFEMAWYNPKFYFA